MNKYRFKFADGSKINIMTIGENYLQNIKKEMLRYKSLGEKAIEQLNPEQLFYTRNEDSNSIANIVNHMYGNMLSRWTDFLTTDGEKPWRNRDGEFENTITDKKEVVRQWDEGWACVFSATDALSENQLLDTVYIRSEALTVLDAINRQLAHYAYHIGQIVFAAKELKEGEWITLSMARKKVNSQ